jgi:hypothetical protein
MSPGVTTFLKPYLHFYKHGFLVQDDSAHISATLRHLSPSPPVTKTVLSFRPSIASDPSTSCLNGVWDCTKFSSVIGTPSFLLSSCTRALSCLPPPLVRRMKGMLFLWRSARASGAPAIVPDDLRRTPSMLYTALVSGRGGVRRVNKRGHTRMRRQSQARRRFSSSDIGVHQHDTLRMEPLHGR